MLIEGNDNLQIGGNVHLTNHYVTITVQSSSQTNNFCDLTQLTRLVESWVRTSNKLLPDNDFSLEDAWAIVKEKAQEVGSVDELERYVRHARCWAINVANRTKLARQWIQSGV